MHTKILKRLMPALEAVKERDAADFRGKRDAAEALRDEIYQLQISINAAAEALDDSDLAAHAAFLRFRSASLSRITEIEGRLGLAETAERAARETLARSHGSVEGCSFLAERAAANRASPKR